MNEEDSAKGGTHQRPVSQVQELKQGKPDLVDKDGMGDWDNFSNLDNTEQMEGMS